MIDDAARRALAVGGRPAPPPPRGARIVGRALVGARRARLCLTTNPAPYPRSERARALHETLWVADLHADSLLWGRDLLRRGNRGHVDVPRLIEGNVALQVFAATTKVAAPPEPRAQRRPQRRRHRCWPSRSAGRRATWRSLLARALHLARRADALAARSGGTVPAHPVARPTSAVPATGAPARSGITAGLLAIEGAHALEDDLANVDVLVDAGLSG